MYYVPDGTQMCGYYECEECGNRFLSLTVGPQMVCPACGEQPDMEIGPDEPMPVIEESAKLLQVIQGEGYNEHKIQQNPDHGTGCILYGKSNQWNF